MILRHLDPPNCFSGAASRRGLQHRRHWGSRRRHQFTSHFGRQVGISQVPIPLKWEEPDYVDITTFIKTSSSNICFWVGAFRINIYSPLSETVSSWFQYSVCLSEVERWWLLRWDPLFKCLKSTRGFYRKHHHHHVYFHCCCDLIIKPWIVTLEMPLLARDVLLE